MILCCNTNLSYLVPLVHGLQSCCCQNKFDFFVFFTCKGSKIWRACKNHLNHHLDHHPHGWQHFWGFFLASETFCGFQVDTFTGSVGVGRQVAFIGRTNMGVFNKLNLLMFAAKSSEPRHRVGLVGGVESYNFEDYLDIHRLSKGRKNDMKKFKTFHSYNQFKTFATNVDDVELLSKIKIVEKYGDRVPELISRICSNVVKDIKTADAVLSTVHKASITRCSRNRKKAQRTKLLLTLRERQIKTGKIWSWCLKFLTF